MIGTPPLDLVRANGNELATDENITSKGNGARKPYTINIRTISANNM